MEAKKIGQALRNKPGPLCVATEVISQRESGMLLPVGSGIVPLEKILQNPRVLLGGGSNLNGPVRVLPCDSKRKEKTNDKQTICCPACGEEHCTEALTLKVKFGVSNLTSRGCRIISPTSSWRCSCSMLWFKSHFHEHQNALSMKAVVVGTGKPTLSGTERLTLGGLWAAPCRRQES